MSYPNGYTFADYASKKTWKCKKCGNERQFIKLFKKDGTLLTVDSKPPNGKYGKESNVFTAPVDVGTQNLHTCYDIEWPNVSQTSDSQKSETKPTLEIPTETDVDKKVIERMVSDSKQLAFQFIAKYKGVKQACLECGIDQPAVIGMIFNNLCNSERKENVE